jgi:chromate transporter
MAMNFPPGPAADPPAPKPNSKVPAAPQPEPAPRPNIAELFTAFAAISLSGFGGVLAWARRIMVEKRRWLTAGQFKRPLRFARFCPAATWSTSR